MSTHDLDPSVSKMEIIERNYYHVWNIFDGDDDEIQKVYILVDQETTSYMEDGKTQSQSLLLRR